MKNIFYAEILYKIKEGCQDDNHDYGENKMTKFKDFGAPVTTENAEEIMFRLYGEDFYCRPQIPGKVMLDLAGRSGNDDDTAASATVITDFFKYVLVQESYTRFNTLCEDPDRIVTIEQLMDIISWLMETYSNRPTQRPEVSPDGQ